MCLNINFNYVSKNKNIIVKKDDNGKEFFYGYKIVSNENRPPYYPKLEYKVGENFSDRETKELNQYEYIGLDLMIRPH